MTTHPTPANAGSAVPDLGLPSRTRATGRVDGGRAALITGQRYRHKGRSRMKCRQSERSHAEYGDGAARTTRLLRRMRDAATVARRLGHRKGDAAANTVPAIEDQLHTLEPICSAQRALTGTTCGAPAVAVAEIHAIDGCNQMGLTLDGDLVETLCQPCLTIVQRAMDAYVGDKRHAASRCGAQPVCSTCGRPTRYLRSVFAVRLIGPEGLPA